MTDDEFTDTEALNRLCWMMCVEYDNLMPLEGMMENIDQNAEDRGVEKMVAENEKHRIIGWANTVTERIMQLEDMGIDVQQRADDYADSKDNGTPGTEQMGLWEGSLDDALNEMDPETDTEEESEE